MGNFLSESHPGSKFWKANTKIYALSDSHSEQKPFKKKSKKKTLSHDSSSDSDDFQPPPKRQFSIPLKKISTAVDLRLQV